MAKKKQGLCRGIIGLTVLGVLGYLVVNLITCQVNISAKQQELSAVQAELDAQLAKNEEISRELDGTDAEITERAARSELDYARPNERVFVDVSGK